MNKSAKTNRRASHRLPSFAGLGTLALSLLGSPLTHAASLAAIESLVESKSLVTRLDEMENQGLQSGTATVQPWSGHYWARKYGGIAWAYADPNYPRIKNYSVEGSTSESYQRFYDYWHATRERLHKKVMTADEIQMLSPAEKYDLLVGDRSFTLANKQWNKFYRMTGRDIADWDGLCHGWSQAASHIARPEKRIDVVAADGRTVIPFFPADIKALATHLWGKAPQQRMSHNIGSRCSIDAKFLKGRSPDGNCRDVLPSDWHLTAVNRLGVVKEAMAVDIDPSAEVWNQPVSGYKYEHFRPGTKELGSFSQTLIRLADYSQDPFRSYRVNAAQNYVVGVKFQLSYAEEPDFEVQAETDSPENDHIATDTFYYDLEVTPWGQIVGGEWYQSMERPLDFQAPIAAHPDFMWNVPSKVRALSDADFSVRENWAAGQPLPGSVAAAGRNASRDNLPLAFIVEKLVEFSRGM